MKNKLNHIILVALVLAAQGVSAQGVKDFFSNTDSFLKSTVENGRVDYAGIKNTPETLNALVAAAQEIRVEKTDAANYQAFWINAYNIFVINSVVKNYPLKSPLHVPGFFDKIKHKVGGENITLNDIENKLLRANFPEEARFHFVLVCAGLGCPPIIPAAYMPATLDAQLEKQTVKALNDNNFIRLKKKKAQISQIFEWYSGDFTQNGASLVDYINTYRTEKLPEDSKVSYYPYDWTLNAVN
jgi:hypothetical protein